MPGTPGCEVCGAATGAWVLRGGGRLWRCPTCGHVLRDLADCPAGARDEAYGGDPVLDRVRLGLTFRRLRGMVPAGGSVFEIGYGAGLLLRRFADAGHPVAGVDADQLGVTADPVVVARGRLLRGELEAVADAGGHDLVYGVHVVEHLRDPVAGLRRAYDLLAPGGRVCLVTPTADSLGADWFGSAWWLLEDPTHVRFFTAASARRLLARVGFVEVRVRRLRLDTLSMEAASLRRRVRPAPRAAGVLAERATLALAAATAPAVLAARAALPRLAPTLEITARRRA